MVHIAISMGVLILLVFYLGVMLQIERKRAIAREDKLIHMMHAKSLSEYAQARRALEFGPEEQVDITKAENELAENAQKMFGVPVV